MHEAQAASTWQQSLLMRGFQKSPAVRAGLALCLPAPVASARALLTGLSSRSLKMKGLV
jgi:hypothetical protein